MVVPAASRFLTARPMRLLVVPVPVAEMVMSTVLTEVSVAMVEAMVEVESTSWVMRMLLVPDGVKVKSPV